MRAADLHRLAQLCRSSQPNWRYTMADATTKSQAPNRPVRVFRLRGVKVAVFENRAETEGRGSLYHKVSIQRIYREGEEFKTTTSLGRDDLPVVRLLLERAWEFILEAEALTTKTDD